MVMNARIRTLGWLATFSVLVVLSVPWFWWGDSRTAVGIPLWLWWHIGWMGLATVVFYLFTRTDWDRYMGVEDV